MAVAWRSSETWKFCRGRNGRKRWSRPATATKSCNLSAGVSASLLLAHQVLSSNSFEQVSHFCFFRLQVKPRTFRHSRLAGNSLHYADAGAFELADFLGVIGEQADFGSAELLQDLG